jgi:ferritin-like metal-binding protein YciE
MEQNALKELYVDELKDLYNAENQLVKALPKMAKAAASEELRKGFEAHLEQTRGHVGRLARIFEGLGESPKGKKCKGMQGLIVEGGEIISENDKSKMRDAGLIAAAQRVEHYEVAGYGCVKAYASLLGDDNAASLLDQTLQEEKETDQKLTQLAGQINVEAANSGDREHRTGRRKAARA